MESDRSGGLAPAVALGRMAESLPGVKRKGTESHPGWYVQDRLVARLLDPITALVRVPLGERESLLATYPDCFGVPPRFEAHHKVEVYLDRAPGEAVRAALRLAWEMQRDTAAHTPSPSTGRCHTAGVTSAAPQRRPT